MHSDCPACGGGRLSGHVPDARKLNSSKVHPKVAVPAGARFGQCEDCGHVFLADAEYREADYVKSEAAPARHNWFFADRRAHVEVALAEMRRVSGKSKLRILDFGCAYGNVARLFMNRGHEAVGYDVAANHVEYARSHHGVEAYSGPWEEARGAVGPVDVIYSENVFEHIPDPFGTLSDVSKRLGAGGVVYLSVPNFDCAEVGYVVPEHLQYFRPRSTIRLAERAGYRVASCRSGRPGIQKCHRLTGRIPPMPLVRAIDWLTSRVGRHGYSIRLCAVRR